MRKGAVFGGAALKYRDDRVDLVADRSVSSPWPLAGSDAVYDAAQASVTETRPFRDLLAEEPNVRAHLTASQIEALLNPARYTGLCSHFAVQAAAWGREIATAIRGWPKMT